MPLIFDSIQLRLIDGLRAVLAEAEAGSFCVGHLNLRGWGQLPDFVERLPGSAENQSCHLLVGMHRTPEEEMKALSGMRCSADLLDGPSPARLKRHIIESFKAHIPRAKPEDERALAELSKRILAAKKNRGPAADTSAWEREIDECVYRLYGLTSDEIKLVEESFGR